MKRQPIHFRSLASFLLLLQTLWQSPEDRSRGNCERGRERERKENGTRETDSSEYEERTSLKNLTHGSCGHENFSLHSHVTAKFGLPKKDVIDTKICNPYSYSREKCRGKKGEAQRKKRDTGFYAPLPFDPLLKCVLLLLIKTHRTIHLVSFHRATVTGTDHHRTDHVLLIVLMSPLGSNCTL